MKSAVISLVELQGTQLAHDLRCHSDILNLPTKEKMTHFTLHFAKYVGRMFRMTNDVKLYQRTLVDSMIITLSAANALNINLDTMIKEYGDPTLKHNNDVLNTRLAVLTGEMAKACESLDHIEHVDARNILEQSVIQICRLLLYWWGYDTQVLWDNFKSGIEQRWEEIEEKRVL